MQKRWRQRTIVDVFRANRNANPKWDALAAEIVDGFSDVKGGARYLENTDLFKRCEEAIALGCDDPLIHAVAGDSAFALGLTVKADAYPSASIPLLAEAGYCGGVRLRFCRSLASVIRNQGAHWEHRRDAVDGLICEAIASSTADGSYKGEERRLQLRLIEDLYEWNTNSWPPAFVAALRHTGKCDSWVLAAFSGRIFKDLAWKERGVDYAIKTTDRQFAQFQATLELA